jgi:hypothetical protein
LTELQYATAIREAQAAGTKSLRQIAVALKIRTPACGHRDMPTKAFAKGHEPQLAPTISRGSPKGGIDLTDPWLNTVGLVLGIAGVVILLIWGPPQPDLDETIGTDEATKRLNRRYEVMPRVGLGLIGLGFFVQLVATLF